MASSTMPRMALAAGILVVALCSVEVAYAAGAGAPKPHPLRVGGGSVAGVWHLTTVGPDGSNSSVTPLILPTTVTVTLNTTTVTVTRNWTDSSGVSIVVDGVAAALDGSVTATPITSRDWPFNVFVGVEYDVDSTGRQGKLVSHSGSSSFTISGTSPIITQQLGGPTAGPLVSVETHALSVVTASSGAPFLQYSVVVDQPKEVLLFWFTRTPTTAAATPAAPASPPALHPDTTRRAVPGSVTAPPYNLNLADNWTLTNLSLQENAMVISLQGLANRNGAVLYLTYPADWAYSYTPAVREYYASSRDLTFTQLSSADEALSTLIQYVKGYVVWDTEVRESLVVAYTAAGLEDAVVVSEAMVPMVQGLGLNMVANFSGVFRGLTPIQIYSKAKDLYWDQCSREVIIWAGGVCGTQIQPGVMDWGVAQRAFFTDLSTVPTAPGYALADELVGDMAAAHAKNPFTTKPPMLNGWHSYCKDYEHTFTTLASKHGGRVHGLNTNPNLSFSNKIKLPAGYKFKNRHSPPPPAAPLDKIAITLVQTDGLGLGAWAKPGRGKIAYCWEVTLPDLEIQPALLQMFYEQATDKDYFVGALGGPGYMYPKAVPPSLLPARLQLAQDMMRVLDLNHFIVFDASACRGAHTVTGDTWLTPDVVEAYFANMNNTLGFLNGYGPTFTFQHSDAAASFNHSLLSFDYYLDPSRSVEEAVADLESLAAVNPTRPYFLAIHVREFSTVGKVEQIIAALDPAKYEVMPVDTFFAYANRQPTWWPHYK